MGRRAPPRLARAARYTVCDLSGFVCVERGFYTFTAYELCPYLCVSGRQSAEGGGGGKTFRSLY